MKNDYRICALVIGSFLIVCGVLADIVVNGTLALNQTLLGSGTCKDIFCRLLKCGFRIAKLFGRARKIEEIKGYILYASVIGIVCKFVLVIDPKELGMVVEHSIYGFCKLIFAGLYLFAVNFPVAFGKSVVKQ